MIGLVIIAHGDLAEAFRKAAVHVMGPQGQLVALGIEPDDNGDERRKELIEAVEAVDDGAGVIVLSDMFGGTPSNLAISLLNYDNVDVIAGVNLPMLIKLISMRETATLSEAVIEAQDAAKKYINVASKLIAANG